MNNGIAAGGRFRRGTSMNGDYAEDIGAYIQHTHKTIEATQQMSRLIRNEQAD